MKRKPYTVQEKEIFLFIEVGIDVNILGREQPQKCLSRLNKIHRIYGVEGLLHDNRGCSIRVCSRSRGS